MFGFGGSKAKAASKAAAQSNRDNYDIFVSRPIGKGSYGTVFKAKSKLTGEIVAVKTIKGVFNVKTDAKRTLRELVILRMMNHPAVVSLVDVLEPERADYKDLSIVFPFYSMDISQLLRTVAAQTSWEVLHVKYLVRVLYSCQ